MSDQTESHQLMIEAVGLTKSYGKVTAVTDVNFAVPRGQVCGLVGPHGAGKSTTMKMLAGRVAPSAGEARIGGVVVSTDGPKAAEILGYLPEKSPPYGEMTPKSYLQKAGQTWQMSPSQLEERLDSVTEQCGLREIWDRPLDKLSRGNRQLVDFAHALLHDPDVLILDQPFSRLDPDQVPRVQELIRAIGGTKTVLISTHIPREVEAVCSREILINSGRIMRDGPSK
jgi:ABC-2 type transport system ATP-binding protein